MNRTAKRKQMKLATRVGVAYTRTQCEKRSTRSDAYVQARAFRLETIEAQYKDLGKDFTAKL